MKFENIKTKQDLEKFVDELFGEGKACEKNLFSAIYLFIKDFCQPDEHDMEHVLSMVLATKVQHGQRDKRSDTDKIFEQMETVQPYASCLTYYNAFKLYPEGMQNQSAGNLAYKISTHMEKYPRVELEAQAKEARAKHKQKEKTAQAVNEWMHKKEDSSGIKSEYKEMTLPQLMKEVGGNQEKFFF